MTENEQTSLKDLLSKLGGETQPPNLDLTVVRGYRDELAVAEMNRAVETFDRWYICKGHIEYIRRWYEVKERLRPLYEKYPAIVWFSPQEFLDSGIFEGMDPAPEEGNVSFMRRNLLGDHHQGGPHPGFPHYSDCHGVSSPNANFGARHTARKLRELLVYEPGYLRETNVGKLVDTVVYGTGFFVPTAAEIFEGMKMIRPALPFIALPPETEHDHGPPLVHASQLERAMRRAQRAPFQRKSERRNMNYVQDWVLRRGIQRVNLYGYGIRTSDLSAELVKDGFLANKPSNRDVEEILRTLVREVKESEKRHKRRLKSKKK